MCSRTHLGDRLPFVPILPIVCRKVAFGGPGLLPLSSREAALPVELGLDAAPAADRPCPVVGRGRTPTTPCLKMPDRDTALVRRALSFLSCSLELAWLAASNALSLAVLSSAGSAPQLASLWNKPPPGGPETPAPEVGALLTRISPSSSLPRYIFTICLQERERERGISLSRESVVYWYSFSNPRTKCIHCDSCLVITKSLAAGILERQLGSSRKTLQDTHCTTQKAIT